MNYNTLYDKYLGVPKKQAKSYELDLGQKVNAFLYSKDHLNKTFYLDMVIILFIKLKIILIIALEWKR